MLKGGAGLGYNGELYRPASQLPANSAAGSTEFRRFTCRAFAKLRARSLASGTTFPTRTTRPSVGTCPTCSTASSGSRARTSGSRCASPARACASSTRRASTWCSPTCAPAASTSEDLNHARKDQARVVRRHRTLLHDDEEQADHARQDRDQEVRSGGAQARRLQGRQTEVSPLRVEKKKAPRRGAFPFVDRRYFCLAMIWSLISS